MHMAMCSIYNKRGKAVSASVSVIEVTEDVVRIKETDGAKDRPYAKSWKRNCTRISYVKKGKVVLAAVGDAEELKECEVNNK